MKHIVKQSEPKRLLDWKALASAGWQPSYSSLSGEIKAVVKSALMQEQGYICCYCERRLTDDDSHIEHFRPQNDPLVDPLDFANLLCSCQNQLKKGEPRHCGNRKQGWFDAALLISPCDPDCETRFAYTGDGGITPKLPDDRAASLTIAQLGLNIKKLMALRSKAIEPFLDDALSHEELRDFVEGYLRTSADGYVGEFYTTIRYLFGEIVSA